MFEALFNDKFTIRRPVSRTVRNEKVYAEPTDGLAGLPIPCRIERRGRRVFTKDGVELGSDATLFFRKGLHGVDPVLALEDLVVAGGETFRIVGMNEQPMLFTAGVYVRLDLARDQTPVEKDAIPDA